MRKIFENISFDLQRFEDELNQLKALLDKKDDLDESKDIKPFFEEHKLLAAQIGLFFPQMNNSDKVAFEYDIFGDFKCDLAIGDHSNNNFCFVEFEDAKQTSIFHQEGTKYKSAFSSRFEHGYSQIIDWFYKLNVQSTNEIEERFGQSNIGYNGLLIIGRSHFLTDTEKNRLKWRMENCQVNSKTIYCLTFDELHEFLDQKLKSFKSLIEQKT